MAKKQEKPPRQVRWHRDTDTADQERSRYRYVFLLINTSTEIRRIKERIWEHFAPIGNLTEITDYTIQHSGGLHGNVFAFSSPIFEMGDGRDIYENLSNFKYDRALRERSEIDSIWYLEKLLRE